MVGVNNEAGYERALFAAQSGTQVVGVYNEAAYECALFAAQSRTQMEDIHGKAAGVAQPSVCVQDSVL